MLTDRQKETYLKYARLSLPRHTSYPIVPVWKNELTVDAYKELLTTELAADPRVGIYLHVPFCEAPCYYCGCNRMVLGQRSARRHKLINDYLQAVKRELEWYRPLLSGASLTMLHLGGGTPTYLQPAELTSLVQAIFDVAAPATGAELSIEVDPRVTSQEHLTVLRELGFNRISVGIQDFHPPVQEAIGRIQPFAMVEQFAKQVRQSGFQSMNFDLIYGLPLQTPASMQSTSDQVVALAPDRIAFYRLAVLPDLFRLQKMFTQKDLPDAQRCLELLLLATSNLQGAGYHFIGLDHFAKETDPLVTALRAGKLNRSFQGMTTGRGIKTVGIGPTAITTLDSAYVQNDKDLASYGEQVKNGPPLVKGIGLSADDKIRREVLQRLYCYGRLNFSELSSMFGFDAKSYFASELNRAQRLLADELITINDDELAVTVPLGRFLVRVVAGVFDRYLPENAFEQGVASVQASQI